MIHMYKPHPWHGISFGTEDLSLINVFIEVVPSDTVKYEIDKETGYLSVDRVQKYSNVYPCLYGFIPQTYCAEEVGKYVSNVMGEEGIEGDKDPLDVCVLTDRNIPRGDIILKARIIGGIRMLDGGEADDKLIGVLEGDHVYGNMQNIEDIQDSVLNKILHYFATYKQHPTTKQNSIDILGTYPSEQAKHILQKSIQDYKQYYQSN